MEFDPILPRKPLSPKNRTFAEAYWGVTEAPWDDTPDCFQNLSAIGMMVSAEIAAVIEELEPGLHELLEIKRVWSRSSGKEVERKFYFLNVYQTARTLDVDRSNVEKHERYRTGEEFYALNAMVPENLVLVPGAGEGRHLWRDDLVPRAAFMSNELKKMIESVGARGFDFMATTPAEEGDLRWTGSTECRNQTKTPG